MSAKHCLEITQKRQKKVQEQSKLFQMHANFKIQLSYFYFESDSVHSKCIFSYKL